MELDVMEQHPTREALAGFLNSTLPAPEAKGVIAHLLGGCLRCQDVMAPLALSLFRPGRDAARLPLAPPAAAAANVEEDTAYEGAIDAAFAAVLARTHAQIAQSAQSSLPLEACAVEAKAAVERFSASPEQQDDMTLLLLRRVAEAGNPS